MQPVGKVCRFAAVDAAYSLKCIAYPSAAECSAVGVKTQASGPILLRSANGGASWSSIHLPSSTLALNDVSCATTTRCEAVGETGSLGPLNIGAVNGASWLRKSIVSSSLEHGFYYFDAITCPTASVCIAGGSSKSAAGALIVTTDAGVKWNALHTPAGAGGVSEVACAATTSCELVAVSLPDPPHSPTAR